MARPYVAFGNRIAELARKQPLFVLGSVGVGLGAIGYVPELYDSYCKRMYAANKLQVMSWNILARPFTKYNKEHHRASGRVEDAIQTVSRYTLAGEDVLNRRCDIVCLQECEDEFTDVKWNLAAPRLLEEYVFFRCPRKATDGPGTAVLVRRGGQAVPLVEPGGHTCIGGSPETGGGSKVATVVPVRAMSREILAVSGHFAWDGDAQKRARHVELISQYVGDKSVVLAGDFNSEPGKSLEEMEKGSSMFGRLKRAIFPEGSMTGLSSDLSEQVCIDHIYTSRDMSHVRAFPMARPTNPWAGRMSRPAKVSGASDHVPIFAELEFDSAEGKS
eukprot:TRINITY_DN31751_c0_g1_i1.p1 TRINITY_DN31751_c0_g1~~TRINITY_DN31751_c0_g1_i1.p1  ORF type:complete len:331 (+),score=26.08 TRINITY_DN31751_c0_g1_i1:45-1037(+)